VCLPGIGVTDAPLYQAAHHAKIVRLRSRLEARTRHAECSKVELLLPPEFGERPTFVALIATVPRAMSVASLQRGLELPQAGADTACGVRHPDVIDIVDSNRLAFEILLGESKQIDTRISEF
jgi:hypothetical protein